MKTPFGILRRLNPFATRQAFGASSRILEATPPKRFRRIGGGEDDIDMTDERRAKARKISRVLYQESPTYGAVVDRYLEHAVGDGVRIEVDNPKAQEWLDEQFDRPENRFHATIGQRLTRLAVDGEYPIQISTIPRGTGPSGVFFLGRLDLERVTGIETSPFNEDAIRKLLISPRVGQGEPLAVPVAEPQTPGGESPLVLLDAQGAPAAGIDKPMHPRLVAMDLWRARTLGKRSGPLFSRIIDKSAALDELVENLVRKVEFLNRFWMHITFDTKNKDIDDPKNQAFVQQALNWATTMEPGEAWVTGQDVSINPHVPDFKLVDSKAMYDMVLDLILGAYAVPRHWFSSGGDTNRATAAEQGSPIHRAISSWQGTTVQPALESLVRFLLWLGGEAGVGGLTRGKGHETPFSVVLADIATRDSLRDAQECSNVILMLNEAQTAGIISPEEHQAIGRATLGAKAYGDHLSETPPPIEEEEPIALDDPRFAGAEPEADGEVPADAGAGLDVNAGVPAGLAT